MPVIDTSWFVALFNPQDTHHERAFDSAGEEGTYLIPHVILSEFISLTNHCVSPQVARRVHKEISRDPAFHVVTNCDMDDVGAIYHSRSSLSYPECVANECALRTGEDLLSFDAKQRRLFQSRRRRPS